MSSVNATYDLYVYSAGEVNGNVISVIDLSTNQAVIAWNEVVVTNGSSSQSVTMSVAAGSGWDVLNMYQAAAYAMLQAYLDTSCGGTSTHGVELDWLRQFWDVHTDAPSQPTFTTMANWLDAAGNWTKTTAYSVLDAEADDVGGSLQTNWNATADYNGVDH